MNKKFLKPFAKLLASFSAAFLLSLPGQTEAIPIDPNINEPIEISDFVLKKNADDNSSILAGHSSHRSHSSHMSHSSHYSSRW